MSDSHAYGIATRAPGVVDKATALVNSDTGAGATGRRGWIETVMRRTVHLRKLAIHTLCTVPYCSPALRRVGYRYSQRLGAC